VVTSTFAHIIRVRPYAALRRRPDATCAGARDADDVGRRTLLLVSVAAAALIAGGLVAALVLTTGGGSKAEPTTAAPLGVSRVARMLDGIPQQGVVLGRASAPVTLVEFADVQCPYCAEWASRGLPGIVQKSVRTGKVRILFNGMAFVGADSETALRTAVAAGRQNRFWNVLELLYENQGAENAGWVTDSLLRSIGDAVPGLDTQKMLDERRSAAVQDELVRAAELAQRAGVNSTPSFAVGRTNGELRLVQPSSLDPKGLQPALDAALSQ
jgi:protein-disulfide isomerase